MKTKSKYRGANSFCALTISLLVWALLPITASADHDPNGRWREAGWDDRHVMVFSECGFEGQSKSIPVGDYANVDNIGIPRNKISSVIVPKGMAVEVFQKRKYGGHWYRLNQSQACLKGKWDNRIAALRVLEDNPRNSYGFSGANDKGGNRNQDRNCHPYTLRAYDGNGAVRFIDRDNGLKQFKPGRDVQGEICGRGQVQLELAKKDRRADVVITLGDRDYVFERWSKYDEVRDKWYIKNFTVDLPRGSKGGGNDDGQQYGKNGWGNTKGFGKRYSSGVDSGKNWGNNYQRGWNRQVAAQQPTKSKNKPKAAAQPQCNTFTASGNHPDTGIRFLVGDNAFHLTGNGTITKQICHSGKVQIELAKKRPPAQVVANINGRSYVFGANDTGDRYSNLWYRKYFTVQLP